jgi:DNA repair exonuclease SbcCD ATPase subunit
MSTVAAKAAKGAMAGSPTGKHSDPLDDEEEDPAVAKARLKAYKNTLVVHEDPSKGVEENEENFQETMLRFCDYLKPEIEVAIKEVEKEELGRSYDALVARTWIPPDEFGARGDMRSVSISYSQQREDIMSKIGIPGHPAPALERWIERKIVEEEKKDWTHFELKEEDILNAEYDTVEEEEEAIIKLLSQKYVKIEKIKREIHGQESKKDEKQALQQIGKRQGAVPVIGNDYAMWDVTRHRFPKAPLNFPRTVSEGDSVLPNRFGEDVSSVGRV